MQALGAQQQSFQATVCTNEVQANEEDYSDYKTNTPKDYKR